ncbi:TPA: hypothetical protein IAA92_01480 [Candidatus Galligastranaerophilus intestinigallinarum]|nr:hypothetical protein [Candidatus Galligastranaerophilus intestinigallinarum]
MEKGCSNCPNKGAEVFVPQTNGSISNSLLQNWTQQAFECYSINCDCALCSIDRKKYSFVCQMPKVIKELLKNNIQPDISLFTG